MKKVFLVVACAALLAAAQSCDMSKYNPQDDELSNQIKILNELTREQLEEQGFALRLACAADGESISFVVYSRKGDNCRWDAFDDDNTYAVFCNTADDAGWEYEYTAPTKAATGDGWTEIGATSAMVKVDANYADLIGDASDLLKDYGFSKTGTTKIFGLDCDVWSGTYTVPSGKSPVNVYGAMTLTEGTQGEFCVWKGLTLRTSVNGKGQTEMSGIVRNVPDKTFSKTLDLSWLK